METRCNYSKQEEWRPLQGFATGYEVSNFGNVRKIGSDIVLKGSYCRRYHYVSLNGTRIGVHRLVGMAFLPNPKNHPVINHIDENPSNNHVENLEWCTHKHNCNHGTRIQRIVAAQSIPVLQYTLDGDFIAEHSSMHMAAAAINQDAGHICDCCNGNRKWAYGYFWRFKDETKYQQAKERITKRIAYSKKSRAEKFEKAALNVVQLDLDGNFIQIFPSTKVAAIKCGTHTPRIINCCNGKAKTAGGFRWVYERDYTEYKRGDILSLF